MKVGVQARASGTWRARATSTTRRWAKGLQTAIRQLMPRWPTGACVGTFSTVQPQWPARRGPRCPSAPQLARRRRCSVLGGLHRRGQLRLRHCLCSASCTPNLVLHTSRRKQASATNQTGKCTSHRHTTKQACRQARCTSLKSSATFPCNRFVHVAGHCHVSMMVSMPRIHGFPSMKPLPSFHDGALSPHAILK